MVITLHRCSYDNSTISSVNKLKQYDASLLFSLLSLFFLSLFFLICFSSLCQICQRVVLFNLLDTKVNPNCLFHRGRENRRSPVVRGGRVVRWCLENIQSRSVLLIWIIVGQGSIALAVGAGGVVWTFFLSSIFSLFFLTLWETAKYRLKYCLKGPLNPKQLTNQIQS